MKNALIIVLSLVFVFLFTSCSMAYGSLNIGFDFTGQYNDTYGEVSHDTDTGTGLSLGFEYTKENTSPIQMGLGITYQTVNFKDQSRTVTFVPVYLTLKYLLSRDENSSYFVGKTGYNWQNGDGYTGEGNGKGTPGGGFYYAIGFGIANPQANVELLYTVNKGTAKVDDSTSDLYGKTLDITYSRISLISCMKF